MSLLLLFRSVAVGPPSTTPYINLPTPMAIRGRISLLAIKAHETQVQIDG